MTSDTFTTPNQERLRPLALCNVVPYQHTWKIFWHCTVDTRRFSVCAHVLRCETVCAPHNCICVSKFFTSSLLGSLPLPSSPIEMCAASHFALPWKNLLQFQPVPKQCVWRIRKQNCISILVLLHILRCVSGLILFLYNVPIRTKCFCFWFRVTEKQTTRIKWTSHPTLPDRQY